MASGHAIIIARIGGDEEGASERVQRIDTAVQRTGNVVTAIVHRPVHDLTNRKRLKSN